MKIFLLSIPSSMSLIILEQSCKKDQMRSDLLHLNPSNNQSLSYMWNFIKAPPKFEFDYLLVYFHMTESHSVGDKLLILFVLKYFQQIILLVVIQHGINVDSKILFDLKFWSLIGICSIFHPLLILSKFWDWKYSQYFSLSY